MPLPLTVGTGAVLQPPPLLLPRFNFWTRARGSGGTLVDGSGRGHTITLGAAGAAPLFLAQSASGGKYLHFPGTAGNSLTVPNAGTVSTGYTITYDDGSTDTATSAANPLTFGGTDAKFSLKKVRSIVFTSGLTGSFFSSQFADPAGTYSDGTNTWTVNRTSTGRKLCQVEADKLILGVDDYFEVADAADLNFAHTDSFTVLLAMRMFGLPTASATNYVAKRTGNGAANTGYGLRSGLSSSNLVAQVADGTTLVTAQQAMVSGVLAGHALVRDARVPRVQAHVGFGVTVTADASANSLSNASVLCVGQFSGAGGGFAEFEFYGLGVAPWALTAEEILRATAELL